MRSARECQRSIAAGEWDGALYRLYQLQDPTEQRQRYLRLVEQFIERFGDHGDVRIYSAPGRTELGGNHTDHQNGRALAASVTLDKIAVAAPEPEGSITLWSESHPIDPMDWRLDTCLPQEKGHSPALIRGILAGFRHVGLCVGGFAACTDSAVPAGSGLSSSASFEILVGTILNDLYNSNRATPIELAKIGRYAENNYFGKPCGLLDQLACAVGGVNEIDFSLPEQPVLKQIPGNFDRWGMALYVVHTGSSHSDLAAEYAAIPAEMKLAASYFGKSYLSEVSEDEFWATLPTLRGALPDRALLRAMHFFGENERVMRLAYALHTDDAACYCREMTASGNSSMQLLQNIYPCDDGKERSLALALALCEKLLAGNGAWRVHGGGFAGTIQALVPEAKQEEFLRTMGAAFGEGSCYRLKIRPAGGIVLEDENK